MTFPVLESRRKEVVYIFSAVTFKLGNVQQNFAVDEPDECPLCHYAIRPTRIYTHGYWINQERFGAIMYLCSHCNQPFVTFLEFVDKAHPVEGVPLHGSSIIYTGPAHYVERTFPRCIADLSPQFVKIYNQAAVAESSGLDEIAGIGYRKALEFLVKDFCIHNYPDKEDEIKKSLLSKCISEYIEYPKIKTLSEKASWIGNDETHYVRKHEDRDIRDMKQFIEAIVHFVTMDLTVEDAASIQRP